ncbi:hypothetical protein OSB04_029165 [Centaurea solstitialis]|uniref:Reverse transcriptase Ty1/copia-type domain-containing protein n=1 Tax=Centaurea solstitialis TaxID=347529 RepID=A0AA38WA09_9ASTR|nr:hypothetical protein OSB04_029165 [Centaurea solstitialis]
MSRDLLSMGSKSKPPVLQIGVYPQWRVRMIQFLNNIDKTLMTSIQEGPIKPFIDIPGTPETATTPAIEPRRVFKIFRHYNELEKIRAELDDKALTLLTMAIPNDLFNRVDSRNTAKELWDELEKQFQGTERSIQAKLNQAIGAYEGFKALEGETLADSFSRFNIILNDLRRNGMQKSTSEINFKFLKNLNPKWDHYSVNLQMNKNLAEEDLHDLYSILSQHEVKVKDIVMKQKSIYDSLALLTEKKKSGIPSASSKKKSHSKALVTELSDSDSETLEDESSESDVDLKRVADKLALLSASIHKRYGKKKFYSKPKFDNYKRDKYKPKEYEKRPKRKSYDKDKTDEKGNAISSRIVERRKSGILTTTLFLKKEGDDLLLVQIYVDDIIFGSTNPELCTKFSKIMETEFEMSMMGELNFFLGIQVKQNPDGIFINQSKYTKDMLKKFNMTDCSPIKTPMPTGNLLGPELAGKSVDQKIYRSMIGSLLYLTATRLDIMFATCFCARFQANPVGCKIGLYPRSQDCAKVEVKGKVKDFKFFPNWFLIDSRLGIVQIPIRNLSIPESRLNQIPTREFARTSLSASVNLRSFSSSTKMSRDLLSMGSKSKPPVLQIGEYPQWRVRMIQFLNNIDKTLMTSIQEGPIKPFIDIPGTPETTTTPTIEPRRVFKIFRHYNELEKIRAELDDKALTLLTMAIPNDLFNRVDSRNTAKELWDELEKQFQGTERSIQAKLNQAIGAYEGFKAL